MPVDFSCITDTIYCYRQILLCWQDMLDILIFFAVSFNFICNLGIDRLDPSRVLSMRSFGLPNAGKQTYN